MNTIDGERYPDLQRYAADRGYHLARGNAKNNPRMPPTGYILWTPRNLWRWYRTLRECRARIDTGR